MEKRGEKKGIYIVVLSVMITTFIIAGVNAGVFDWFKATITGKLTTQPTNISITIAGANPVTINVWNQTLVDAAVDPSEEGASVISFAVTVNDADGINDINDSSVQALVSRLGVIRSNSTACFLIAAQATSSAQNYTCSVKLWYFDAPGAWVINVTANDLGNLTYIYNTSTTFSYDQLQAIKLSPPVIYWTSVSIGSTNKTAANFTTINNTGNYNATEKIAVNATNLYSGSNILAVGNITSDVDTGGSGCSGDACTECDGTVLSHGADTSITGIFLDRGNLSAGEANETLYYCLKTVPTSIPSGTYDTTTGGSWSIKLV